MFKNNKINVSRPPKQSRYIINFENVYDALDVYERSVYEALRFHADYSKEYSNVEMSIDALALKSKIKRRKIFYVLKQLEEKYFLIRRTNWENGTYGKINCYEVAMNLYYFKPTELNEKECANDHVHTINEEDNESYIEEMHNMHGVVQDVHGVDENAHEKFNFEDFWKLYPVKKNKKRSQEIWNNKKLHKIAGVIKEKLIKQIEKDPEWAKGYIPHVPTYLNGERWNDELFSTLSFPSPQSLVEPINPVVNIWTEEEKNLVHDFKHFQKYPLQQSILSVEQIKRAKELLSMIKK